MNNKFVSYLVKIFCAGMLLSVSLAVTAQVTVEKLTWAGIKLEYDTTTVFIDAVGTDLWDGSAPGGLMPLKSSTSRTYALITHAHNDHFDPDSLESVLGDRGYVIVHEDEASYVASRGLRVIPARFWEPVSRGGFLFTAVPAVDGLGDNQVSWVITVDDKRFIHAGDTLWHGAWEKIGQQFGPFDLAFLPINGAKLLRDPMPESAISMNPIQAVDAAMLLRATSVLPIHYGLDDPPYYVEFENSLETFVELAEAKSLTVFSLQPGEQAQR